MALSQECKVGLSLKKSNVAKDEEFQKHCTEQRRQRQECRGYRNARNEKPN